VGRNRQRVLALLQQASPPVLCPIDGAAGEARPGIEGVELSRRAQPLN